MEDLLNHISKTLIDKCFCLKWHWSQQIGASGVKATQSSSQIHILEGEIFLSDVRFPRFLLQLKIRHLMLGKRG